jgi:hypothetical protein
MNITISSSMSPATYAHGAIVRISRGGICASMTIATSPSAKRSKCASNIGRLRPDALNSTTLPTPPTRHRAMNNGPSRCRASNSCAPPVRVRWVREVSRAS